MDLQEVGQDLPAKPSDKNENNLAVCRKRTLCISRRQSSGGEIVACRAAAAAPAGKGSRRVSESAMVRRDGE